MKNVIKKVFSTLLVAVTVAAGTLSVASPAYAKSEILSADQKIYTLDAKNGYKYSAANAKEDKNVTPLGTLEIVGDAEDAGNQNGIKKIDASDGNLKISYSFKKSDLPSKDDDWHLVGDSYDEINGEVLSGDIKEGGILIQTSLNGEDWINSGNWVNYFAEEKKDPIYKTTEIQLLNGCYYRIVVAYKEQKLSKSSQILFYNKKDYDTRRVAEVYTFYAIDEDANSKSVANPKVEPRQELGETVNAGHDTGYSKKNEIDSDDVHYGWKKDIGTFTINGFTQKQEKDGVPVFLKNVGDQVTLWFTLDQDIDKLNGRDNLEISEDTNGFDENFQTKKTNLGRGALIIQYTDCEGHKHDPVIYTDYLSACSTTSADTRVVLYEEGDYEVALDYEIKHTPRKVGPVEIVPEYHDYRKSFKFSVHNGNAMVYPFDIGTGSELLNRSITPNGFRIDLANSKDLDIFVTQTNITVNSNGKHVEDSRGEKTAKDGAEYTKPGVYTIKVKNPYTDKETTKTIYVGDDEFLKALAGSGLTVKELDDALKNGYTIAEDGSLVEPLNPETEVQETVSEGIEVVESESEEEKKERAAAELSEKPEKTSTQTTSTSESSRTVTAPKNVSEDRKDGSPVVPVVVGLSVAAALIGAITMKKHKKNRSDVNGGDEQ